MPSIQSSVSIQDTITAAIKAEIINDPYNVGYAGLPDDQIAILLNNPVSKTSIIGYQVQAPINRILTGVQGVANVIQPTDVTTAKK